MKGVPEIVFKGWGSETIIHNSDLYCGKVLMVGKGFEGSGHFHLNKTETWYLQSGLLRITTINPETAQQESVIMKPMETYHIPKGKVHKMFAIEDSVIFEVSTQHFDSDTYRISPGSSQTNDNK